LKRRERVTDLQFDKPWALLVGGQVTEQSDKDVTQLSSVGLVEIDFGKGEIGRQIRGGYSWLAFDDHSRIQRSQQGAGGGRNATFR